MKKKLLISSLVAAFLIGCGGGNGSSSDSNSTKSGTFEDAPVQGLAYETTSGLTGTTDGNGTFKYKDGDAVTFKIGNIVLGSTKGESLVTPYNITNDASKVQTIAYVLQSLDTDGNATDGVIKLPDEKVLKNYLTANSIDEVNVTDIKTKIAQKLKNIKFPDVNKSKALDNLNKYLSKKVDDSFIKDALKNGLEALKNRTVYFGYIDDFSVGDIGTVTFNKDNSFVGEVNGTKYDGNKVLKWGKYVTQETEKEWGDHNWTLLKIDVAKNLMFYSDGTGIYVVASSKDKLDNYVKESRKEFPREKIDAKELKGKYLYFINDDNMEVEAVKADDDKFEYYNIDDFEDTDENYTDSGNSEDIKYLDNGKLEYEGKENLVEKIPLAGRSVSALTLGDAFDSKKVTNMLSDLGVNYVKFRKGNAYCLSEDACALDKDAMEDLYSAVENMPADKAIKKGNAKTPKSSKVSDYLKDKHYSVYTETGYLDYEENWVEDNKFHWHEIEAIGGTPDTDDTNLSKIESITKVISEYDNGILAQVNHDGFNYKIFFYNNEDDAKNLYEKLAPIYKKYLNKN